jgi:RNA polymerase sigma-70 factor (ECF subfamily)
LHIEEREAVAQFLAQPDSQSYSALFRVLVSRVTGYFRARGCRPPVDEDLAQDVLLTVYLQSHQLRDRNLFRPWLFKIARNTLLQYRRKPEFEEAGDLDIHAGPASDPLAGMQMREWLAVLNPEEREAILLRYVEGLEYHEIASALEIPMGTAQWRVFQSKKKLAARFGRSA